MSGRIHPNIVGNNEQDIRRREALGLLSSFAIDVPSIGKPLLLSHCFMTVFIYSVPLPTQTGLVS